MRLMFSIFIYAGFSIASVQAEHCFTFFQKLSYGVEKILELPTYSKSQLRTVINGAKILSKIKSQRDVYIPMSKIDNYHSILNSMAIAKIKKRVRTLENSSIKHTKELSAHLQQRLMPSITKIRFIQMPNGRYIPFDGGGRMVAIKHYFEGHDIKIEGELLFFDQVDLPEVHRLLKEVIDQKEVNSHSRRLVKIGLTGSALTVIGGGVTGFLLYRNYYSQYYDSIYPKETQAEAIGFDQIYPEGGDQEIIAQVRSIHLNHALEQENNVELEFFLGGKRIHKGVTNEQGLYQGKLEKQLPVGNHKITIKVKKDNFNYKSVYFTLSVLPKKKPIAIVDIDNTLSRDSGLNFIKGLNKNNDSIRGAHKLTSQLSETHQIVYLTHRSNLFLSKTNKWLAQENYPAGPVIYSDYLNPESEDFILFNNSAEYKIRTLKSLQDNFPGNTIEIGIGDKHNDAIAYDAIGIKKNIILNDDLEKKQLRFPSETIFVDRWGQAGMILNRIKKAP